jgi:NADH-quinone oxidoreductase subunit L
LLAAYQHNAAIYWIALFTSGLTAFYMFRLYFSIFWNREHLAHSETTTYKKSEGPFVMMLPLIIMAIGAATAGYIPFGKYVSTDGKPLESHFDLSFSILPVVLGFAGIVSAWILYKNKIHCRINCVHHLVLCTRLLIINFILMKFIYSLLRK